MPKYYLQYPVVQIDPGLLAREATLLQVRDNQTNGTQKSQQVDGSGNVQPAGDTEARGVFVKPTDGTNSQSFTALGEATVSVTQPLPAGSNIIGNVRIDQTTPGTTNGVVVNSSALPTGAATSANQVSANASLSSIDSKLTAPLSVTGPLTDTQLRASAVPVSAASLPLPAGAATSANQATANASLSSIDSKLTAPLSVTGPLTDTQLRASAVPVSAASLPLPSGASTSANQTTANSSLSSIDAKTPALVSGRQPVDGSGVTQPVSAVSLPLPTGAATETTAAAISGKLPATLGQKTSANSMAVVFASDQTPLPAAQGRTPIQFVRYDYSGGTVTTGAYTQLIASTAGASALMEIFDSSGQTLKIAFGGSGTEVDQFLVFPGGNGVVSVAVPASTRISIRAVSASASVGEIDINLYR